MTSYVVKSVLLITLKEEILRINIYNNDKIKKSVDIILKGKINKKLDETELIARVYKY